MTFEYKIEKIVADYLYQETEYLNKMGDDSWELVGIFRENDYYPTYTYYWKRTVYVV